LGNYLDMEIVRRTGRSYNSVTKKRAKLGLPYRAIKFRRWTDEEDQLLGDLPDEQAAQRLNRTVTAIASRRAVLGIRKPQPSR
jgi:hypothetical protein